jgi:hypothetical protein
MFFTFDQQNIIVFIAKFILSTFFTGCRYAECHFTEFNGAIERNSLSFKFEVGLQDRTIELI